MTHRTAPPVGALTVGEIAALQAWADDRATAAEEAANARNNATWRLMCDRMVRIERERAAALAEALTYRARWVRAGANGSPVAPCELAAAIRAGG